MIRPATTALAALLAVACSTPTTKPVQIPQSPNISGLVDMLNSGEISSESLVNELLSRIDKQSSLNAFITINPEIAVLARERDNQRKAGEILGPLHGIPLVAKDNIHVAGLPNSAGTPALQNFVPTQSNGTVDALQRAGAIILGKTNMHELAFGITSNNAAFGAVGNPRNPALFAGGSSGGTAAAIAGGMAPAGLGTDTGGSVRIPAALTGIAGFRPSPGRYPSQRVTPISKTRDTVGVMGAGVSDLVMLDEAITGEPQQGKSAAGELRLGLIRSYYQTDLEPATEQVFNRALATLQKAGVTLVEVQFPDLGLLAGAGFPIAVFEARRDLTAYLARFRPTLTLDDLAADIASPDVKGIFAAILDESTIPESVYRSALMDIAQMNAEFERLFEAHRLDAMVFPTSPVTARPIIGSDETIEVAGKRVPTFPSYIRNTDPASLAGLPGISLAAGTTDTGLPVGLEIDGKPGSDSHLLQAALLIETLLRQ